MYKYNINETDIAKLKMDNAEKDKIRKFLDKIKRNNHIFNQRENKIIAHKLAEITISNDSTYIFEHSKLIDVYLKILSNH